MIFPIVRDGEHEDDQASEGRHEDQPVRQRGRLAAWNNLRPVAAPEDRAAVAVGGAVFPAAAGNASLETAPCVFDKMKDLARSSFELRLDLSSGFRLSRDADEE